VPYWATHPGLLLSRSLLCLLHASPGADPLPRSSLQSLTLLMLMLPDPRARQAAYGAFKAVRGQPCALISGTALLLMPWLQVKANTPSLHLHLRTLPAYQSGVLRFSGPADPARVEELSIVPTCLLLEKSRLCSVEFQPSKLAAKRRKDSHVLGRLLRLPRWDPSALAF
jgi:hypothetical protein